MEKITSIQEDRLLDYLDGKLEGAGLQQLKTELGHSALLQARLEELRFIHMSLSRNKLESPSESFVKNVMQNLKFAPSSGSISPRNGLFLLGGMVVAAGILMLMMGAGVFDHIIGNVSFDQVEPIKKVFQNTLPALAISGKLIVNVVVGINLILVFLVLDRTVLRPFFQRRVQF